MDPYRFIASRYDQLIEPLNAKLKNIALSLCPPRAGLAVLDVGCGTGTLLERYVDLGSRAFGIDPSSAMLEVARRRLGSRAELALGDARAMPFGEDSFDVVTFSMMLHELAPTMRNAVVREACRVLRADGRLLVIDYHHGPFGFPRGWLVKGFTFSVERIAGGEHFSGYRHFVTHGAIPGLARNHTLEIETHKIVGHGNFGVFLLRPRSILLAAHTDTPTNTD